MLQEQPLLSKTMPIVWLKIIHMLGLLNTMDGYTLHPLMKVAKNMTNIFVELMLILLSKIQEDFLPQHPLRYSSSHLHTLKNYDRNSNETYS